VEHSNSLIFIIFVSAAATLIPALHCIVRTAWTIYHLLYSQKVLDPLLWAQQIAFSAYTFECTPLSNALKYIFIYQDNG